MTTWTNVFGGSPVNPSDVTYQAIALTDANSPVQLSWPTAFYEGTITAGHIIDISSTTTLTGDIVLGSALQVSTGQDILFRNVGAEDITIQDYTTGFLLSVRARRARRAFRGRQLHHAAPDLGHVPPLPCAARWHGGTRQLHQRRHLERQPDCAEAGGAPVLPQREGGDPAASWRWHADGPGTGGGHSGSQHPAALSGRAAAHPLERRA